MTSAVELGIRNYLAAQLSATSQQIGTAPAEGEVENRITVLGSTIAGVVTSLHCNIAKDDQPGANPWIVIGCHDCPHQGGPLYFGMIRILVSTPQFVSTINETQHRAIITAVRACFPDIQKLAAALAQAVGADNIAAAQAALDAANAKLTALSAAVLATSGCTATSLYFMSPDDSLGDGRWQTELRYKLCLIEQS